MNFYEKRNVKLRIGGIPGGGSDRISNRLTLLSNLVKDSLTYAFQEALKPNVEKLINGPIVRDFISVNRQEIMSQIVGK